MKPTIQNTTILIALLALSIPSSWAQKGKAKVDPTITIPMESAYWDFEPGSIEFLDQEGVQSAHLKTGAPMHLKHHHFSNGTLEFDIAFGGGFPGISFHLSADRQNGDHFYLRYFGTTSPESRTTLQYAAVIDGMSIWDLTDEYQAGATLKIPGWNHVKLVISGMQMKAYVNDMVRAAMIVPALESGMTDGGMSFSGGEVMIANFVIRPDAVEGLSPAQGYISTYNDTRYLRHWQVSPAQDYPQGQDIVPPLPYMGGTRPAAQLPDSTMSWKPIVAEARGIINLTRLYGHVDNNKRRLAWLKTTIQSENIQERILSLGFSDEIWLFVNGQLLHVDKNHFGTPSQKFPRGRCTIENATVRLPLREGDNEILVGLSNYFYGWGMIARLDDTDGIHLP